MQDIIDRLGDGFPFALATSCQSVMFTYPGDAFTIHSYQANARRQRSRCVPKPPKLGVVDLSQQTLSSLTDLIGKLAQDHLLITDRHFELVQARIVTDVSPGDALISAVVQLPFEYQGEAMSISCDGGGKALEVASQNRDLVVWVSQGTILTVPKVTKGTRVFLCLDLKTNFKDTKQSYAAADAKIITGYTLDLSKSCVSQIRRRLLQPGMRFMIEMAPEREESITDLFESDHTSIPPLVKAVIHELVTSTENDIELHTSRYTFPSSMVAQVVIAHRLDQKATMVMLVTIK